MSIPNPLDELVIWKEIIFYVDDKSYLVTDPEPHERNQEFLRGFDPDFFHYSLRKHTQHIEDADTHYAATSIRATLHHVLETLFTLIGILLQAPDCAYAWIAKCRTCDLLNLVNRIENKDKDLFTKFKDQEISWEGLALRVLNTCEPKAQYNLGSELVVAYGKLLKRLANEFKDGNQRSEYNAIKHGFRIQPGGFQLRAAVAPHETSLETLDDEEMELLVQGRYGLAFFNLSKLSKHKNERGYSIERVFFNWDIPQTIRVIQLTHALIVNIVSALKVYNKISEKLRYCAFPDLTELDRPWNDGPGKSMMRIKSNPVIESPPYVTRKILDQRTAKIMGEMKI